MTAWWALGILLFALAGAICLSVRRRHVRAQTVRRVRASLAPWLTSDMAAPLQPAARLPECGGGFDPAGAGRPPDLLVPAVRRHFELTPYEIDHYRRVS